MAVTFEEFFQLLGKSRLLRPNQLEHLKSRLPGDHNQEDAKPLARRLVMDRVITRYQATVLLGGRSGPFLYGDYQVFDRIRGGRLSGMFKAVHTPTGHPVLLKFASGDVAQDARQWELADRYVRAQTQAVHAQLQRVCELADLTKYRFLVLENLSGQSLQNALENGKRPVPTDEACRLTRLVAMGLTYLHQHGHVYGDVRPRNLWLEPNGNIRFLRDNILPPAVPDIFADDLREEELDRFDYMAPELANPGTPVSPLTDIYALGCTLYELLSGTRPFPGGKPNEKLERHATEPIKPLDSAGVPAELREVVAYMMAKQATVRTSDASEIVEQLSRYVSPDDLPIPPSTPTATQIAYDVAIRQQAPTPVPPPAHVPPPPAAPAPAPVTTKPAPAPEPIPPGMPANDIPAASASQVPVASDSPASNAIGGVQVIHTEEASQTSDRVRRVRQAQRNRTKMLAAFALTLIVASLGVLAFSPRARMALFGSNASDSDKQISQSTEPQTPEEPKGPDEKPNEPVESGEPTRLVCGNAR